MTRSEEPQDYESLLADVERTLSGQSSRPPERRGRSAPERSPGRLARRTSTATAAASTAAIAVWLLFAILPFLRAGSGAAGAFLATFVAVLVFPRR
jgi:hypothetical protein